MFKNKLYRALFILSIVAVNVGCDQVTKVIVRNNVEPHSYTQIIGRYFTLTRVENTGAFLSLAADADPLVKKLLLIGLPTLVMLIMLGYVILKTDVDKVMAICMATIVGGGLGNIYDRFMYGSVTDFFHIRFSSVFQTGIFNIADVSVMVGAGVLLLYSFLSNKKKLVKSEPAA